MRKALLSVFILAVCLCVFPGTSSGADNKVLRVRDGKIIAFARMLDEIKKTDFAFVGEVHDMIEHHEDELAVISALHESGTPVAVGLEMFRSDSQGILDSWIKGALSVEDFLPAYYDNWRMPWPLYREIFQYAREHEIPMIGLNISDKIAKKVARKGFASLSPEEKKQLLPGISCSVDPTYMAFIRKAYAGHTVRPEEFVNFCEAQMVWDKSMAWRLMAYLRKHPGMTVVVLAGVGHAWKRGIPEQVAVDSKFTYRVILPLVPDQIDKDTVTINDADYVLLE